MTVEIPAFACLLLAGRNDEGTAGNEVVGQ